MEQPPLIDVPPLPKPTLPQQIEGLLFVSGEALQITQLAQVLETPADAIEQALEVLQASYLERGLRIQRHGDALQIVTAPEVASTIEKFLGGTTTNRLSPAALEVLAIIAYRQPITKAQIEAIRGVDCGGVMRALLVRDLIHEAGRLDTVGRPILYATTEEFLRQFGLASLLDLPPFEVPDPPTSA
jgi:segregation and condensation protein B